MSIVHLEAARAKKNYVWHLARSHQSHESVKAMDKSIRAFLSDHGAFLSKAALTILNHLSTHSLKVPGVSFGSIAYIKKKTGYSEPSVHRALKELEELIERIPTKTPTGRQGSNLCVIKHYQSSLDETIKETINDTLDDTLDDTPENQLEPAPDKRLEPVSGDRNEVNLVNPKKDIDFDNINRKLCDPKYLHSKFFNHVIQGINLPQFPEIVDRMIQQYSWQQFILDKPSDLIHAIDQTRQKFLEYYDQGHRISSVAAYFAAIFEDCIKRRRLVRLAG